MKQNHSLFLRIISVLLILLLTVPCLAAPAADEASQAPEVSDAETAAPEAEGNDAVSESVPAVDMSFMVNAKAALLIDLHTGRTVYEQNADQRVYPASLTKIMTCLLALENGNLSDTITVSESAFAGLDDDSSLAGLIPGEQMTLEQILYCMMIVSGNEACNVVAEYISGSVEDFVRLMNERAYELGCENTHFMNPHGLHDESHYTTARDLSVIAEAALKSANFRQIVSVSEYEMPATNLSEERTLTTTNLLITKSSSNRFYYPRATGVKTGYTSAAGRCLISTAVDDDMELLAIVCGADTSIADDGSLLMESFPECIKLFNYGFDNYSYVNVLSPLYPVCQVGVQNSAGSEKVALAPAEEIRVMLPNDYDEEKLITDIHAEDTEAPVHEGDVLGDITVKYGSTVLGQTKLIAIAGVERSEISAATTTSSTYIQQHWWKWVVVFIAIVFVLFVALLVWIQVAKQKKRRARMQQRREALQKRINDDGE